MAAESALQQHNHQRPGTLTATPSPSPTPPPPPSPRRSAPIPSTTPSRGPAASGNYIITGHPRNPHHHPGHPHRDGQQRDPPLRNTKPRLHQYSHRRAQRGHLHQHLLHPGHHLLASRQLPINDVSAVQQHPTTSSHVTPGTLTITTASVTLNVAANNVSRTYGAPNPTFTSTITGALNGDTFTITYATTATQLSPVGNYPVVPTVSGPALGNYTLSPRHLASSPSHRQR